MIRQVFTIYDSKADCSLDPIYQQSVGTACRAFEAACNNPETDFAKFPGDYTLFHLGEYNAATMEFTHLEVKANLGLALSFVKKTLVPIQGGE